jgi:hypothetical protein
VHQQKQHPKIKVLRKKAKCTYNSVGVIMGLISTTRTSAICSPVSSETFRLVWLLIGGLVAKIVPNIQENFPERFRLLQPHQ